VRFGLDVDEEVVVHRQDGGAQLMSSMAKMWFDANPMPFGYRIWASTPMASSRRGAPRRPMPTGRSRRTAARHASRGSSPAGLDGVAADAGPQLTIEVPRGDPSRLLHRHAVLQAAGARSSHKEGGSVKWASQSTIPTLSSVSVPTGSSRCGHDAPHLSGSCRLPGFCASPSDSRRII